jgi:hypothetical protein
MQKVLMKSEKIERLNHTFTTLKHFVDVSSTLLPILDEINQQAEPSDSDLMDRESIIQIYNTFNFENETSSLLVHSSILELIKKCFHKLVNKENAQEELMEFFHEYQYLQKNWSIINAN